MKEKLLSVIVPVYNAGNYLEPLIKSILNQTWKNIELILVDDGSTDESAKMCDNYAQKDSRIIVIHQNNSGQSSARNRGLEVATGNYIAFADHDDYLHPYMYETLIKELINTNTKVCACNFMNVLQEQFENVMKDRIKNYEVFVYSSTELVREFLKPTWRIPIWNKVYCREIIQDMKFTTHHLGEDNLFSYNIIKKSGYVSYVNEAYYFQRMHGNNFEFTGIKYFTDLLEAKEKIVKDIKITYPQEYRTAKKLFLYECIRIFNIYVKKNEDAYIDQKNKTVDIMKRNLKGIVCLDIPIGHKILFWKLKLYNNVYKDQIII